MDFMYFKFLMITLQTYHSCRLACWSVSLLLGYMATTGEFVDINRYVLTTKSSCDKSANLTRSQELNQSCNSDAHSALEFVGLSVGLKV